MIQFWQVKPPVVVVSAIGLEGQERVYDERIQMNNVVVDIGMIVGAEVCQLEPGRYEYETKWGGREIKYYLPKRFSETEFGGHELGQHRLWVRVIRPTTYTANVGDIPYLTRSIS